MIGMRQLRESLERVYERYNRHSYVGTDPISFLYEYEETGDREVAALAASALAFGNVKQIMRSVASVLGEMGDSPRGYIMNAGPREIESAFSGFRHRWADGGDIACLLIGARGVIETHGSLENCMTKAFDASHSDVMPALTALADELSRHGEGYAGCLVPSPGGGSACKRYNLFLRWMVRHDEVDPGGWSGIPAAKLLVPLDVHMHRWGTLFGFTARAQADIRAAREVTEAFAEMTPDDPVKYDFALTRLAVLRDGSKEAFIERLGIEPAHRVH
jgi:uncharacterized protein (TIGR02757 family)